MLAIEVYSNEPAKENILFNNPKVILTPHIAASTAEASIVVAEMIANQISNFLLKGDKLKVTVMFRGREFTRQEAGYNLLMQIKEVLQDISVVDKEPNLQGKRLSLILSPK